jgi:hypothetical protein
MRVPYLSWLSDAVSRRFSLALAAASVAVLLAFCLVVLETRFARVRSKLIDSQDGLVFAGLLLFPFLLLAAAALRGRTSRLAWGLLAAGLIFVTLFAWFVVNLLSQELIGDGMGEGIFMLWMVIGQYAVSVLAIFLGGLHDFVVWRMRRRRAGPS